MISLNSAEVYTKEIAYVQRRQNNVLLLVTRYLDHLGLDENGAAVLMAKQYSGFPSAVGFDSDWDEEDATLIACILEADCHFSETDLRRGFEAWRDLYTEKVTDFDTVKILNAVTTAIECFEMEQCITAPRSCARCGLVQYS